MKDILKALSLIRDKKPDKGVVECPSCKGKLNYTRLPNKKVYGKCETMGCLSWMM
jgi:hypothetical protein